MSEINKVNLSGSAIAKERVSCTGHQLSMVLSEIKDLTQSYIWYAADVLAPGKYVIELFEGGESKQVPLKIGTTDDLIKFASPVSQFERGLFLGVEMTSKGALLWNPDEFDTEDSDYIEPCALLVRAFDTSYFEVCSKRKDIVDYLTKSFA
jgi:hypothetical protein